MTSAVSAGWSGGRPYALACGALLPMCRAVATLAGLGSNKLYPGFLEGMADEKIAEFSAALAGEGTLRAWLLQHGDGYRNVTDGDLAEELDGLAPPVDRAVLNGGFADALADSMHRALRSGFDGCDDNDLAFAMLWRFDLSGVVVPVEVWQGDLRTMAPKGHGEWLVSNIPNAIHPVCRPRAGVEAPHTGRVGATSRSPAAPAASDQIVQMLPSTGVPRQASKSPGRVGAANKHLKTPPVRLPQRPRLERHHGGWRGAGEAAKHR